MTHLDLLLPFSLPPKELARDILRPMNAPAAATLLGRSASGAPFATVPPDDFSRSLPHERWLAEMLGLGGNTIQSSPATAPCLLRQAKLTADGGWWFLVQPAHLHVALDHLVLTDRRTLFLEQAESLRLFDAARPVFEEAGLALRYIDPMHWLLRADAWEGLRTATPDAACGRNIDIWMPEGQAASAWRKLLNEIQMTWFAEFTDTLHADREARGLKAVNSLWLWGGGPANATETAGGYDVVYNLESAFGGCCATRRFADQVDVLAGSADRVLLVVDDLTGPALASDWADWIRAFQLVETLWLAPFLAALQEGRLSAMTIILSDGDRLAARRCTRTSLRKFWKKSSLNLLAA